MIPIVALLLKFGLPLLANGVLAKGEDWVKEKTGVDVQSALGTEEGRIKLRQAELEHEEELLKIRLEDDKLSLEFERVASLDRDSARKRELEIATSANSPILNKIITPALALLITGGFFSILGYMMWCASHDTKLADGIKDPLLIMLGALGTSWTGVIAYYFGSSSSSAQKGLTIDKLSGAGK